MRVPKQDHLVCFLGGTMMIGAAANSTGMLRPPRTRYGSSKAIIEDWRVGHEITRSCVDTYLSAQSGLSPEIAFFDPHKSKQEGRAWLVKRATTAGETPPIDSRNILRPETVESLYIGYELTGDPLYREWGWKIFEAFRKYCRTEDGAYTGIDDVDSKIPKRIDRMETFWLSETLKYLYLLFSERHTFPLHAWVFNTEAHPLPAFTPYFHTSTQLRT